LLNIFLRVANLVPAWETKEVKERRRLWTYLLLQCCGVSMTSTSSAVASAARKGNATCVENFQVSCFSEQAGFWLSQLTFTAGPFLPIFHYPGKSVVSTVPDHPG